MPRSPLKHRQIAHTSHLLQVGVDCCSGALYPVALCLALHADMVGSCMQANKARQFTDTASFTLRCGTCKIGVKGEKEALEHAKSTGHANFSEYH